MRGQLQLRKMDNKASCNKRSAAAAKCQDVYLDDNGTETDQKSGKWRQFSRAASCHIVLQK